MLYKSQFSPEELWKSFIYLHIFPFCVSTKRPLKVVSQYNWKYYIIVPYFRSNFPIFNVQRFKSCLFRETHCSFATPYIVLNASKDCFQILLLEFSLVMQTPLSIYTLKRFFWRFMRIHEVAEKSFTFNIDPVWFWNICIPYLSVKKEKTL